ncbi:glycosyltransferase [bacterium]|nr:glycosyltransferase [bacterium]
MTGFFDVLPSVEQLQLIPGALILILLLNRYILGRFFLWLARKSGSGEAVPEGLPTVCITVPMYNEGLHIQKTIRSIQAIDYPADKLTYTIVDDCSADRSVDYALEAIAGDPRGTLLRSRKNQGKRISLIAAVRLTQAEFIVSVDSDVRIEPGAIRALMKRFTSPQIAAVGGRIAVENANQNWLTMLQTVKYFIGYEFLKDLENAFGSVLCLSGCLTAYRRKVLLEVEHTLLNRQLFGCAIKYGEDRFLTRQIVLRGYRTHLEKAALCFTRVPESLSELISQQVRWRRSNLVDFLGAFPRLGRLHPVVAIHYLCVASMLFLYPLFVLNHIVDSAGNFAMVFHLAVLGFLGLHYRMRTRDLPEAYRVSPASLLPLGILMPVTYLLLTPLAFFTLDSSSWETRKAP